MKDIETLLNKYFEGETTCEEERELCHFFTEGLVPEHLLVYSPMFSYFDTECLKHPPILQPTGLENKQKKHHHYLAYSIGVAATLLLLTGIAGVFRQITPASTNYVVIDGKRYTDATIIRKQAAAAFQEICLSEDDVFNTLFEEQ